MWNGDGERLRSTPGAASKELGGEDRTGSAASKALRRERDRQPAGLPPPQPGPQTDFYNSRADIVIFGGAAGGGKTHSLLMECLRHRGNPDFNFVIFRRTSPQITANGGLWDASLKLFPKTGAKANLTTLTWKFPSGAKGKMAHLQRADTVHDWQGTEVPLICFDELTHFTEDQFFYLLSRNRSTSGVRPYIRATTNPKAGSWVKKFLSPWLDKNRLDRAAHGELRWFTRVNGEIVWVAEDWRDDEGLPGKSVTFIFSSVYDNKILLDIDPHYLVNLKSLPEVEQARLLRGDWDIQEGAYFSEWSEAKHVRLPSEVPAWHRFFGGLDYGKAAPFCFLLMASDDEGNVTVMDEVYETRLTPGEQAVKVAQALERYGIAPKSCPIYADPSIFPPQEAKARAGHPGKYIAEEYWGEGLNVIRANNDRVNGWARVREYLHEPGALTVFRGRCPNLIRTIGTLGPDPRDLEDVDTTAEDHSEDALRYGLLSRPARAKRPEPTESRVLKYQGVKVIDPKRLPHALTEGEDEW
jgi:hypothetical protein